MAWNPDTGEFDTPPARKRTAKKTDLQAITREIPDMISHYDDEEFPRTQRIAEAWVCQYLVFNLCDTLWLEEETAFTKWTKPQQERFRKAIAVVARRLIKRIEQTGECV